MSQLLGDVDQLVLERILETGASPDEIAEALLVVEDEPGLGEESNEPSSSRVVEVRAVLHDMTLLDEDEEEE